MRGDFALEWASGRLFVEIEDVTAFVAEQRAKLEAGEKENLLLPVERAIELPEEVRKNVGMGEFEKTEDDNDNNDVDE